MRVRPLIYGFVAAALAGALAAVLTHSSKTHNQRDDYLAAVTQMVLSSDQETRRDGWANIDEGWSEQEIFQLETELTQSSKEIILAGLIRFLCMGNLIIKKLKNLYYN